MSAHVFCRDLCLARGEPLAGTGKLAERTLLLRQGRLVADRPTADVVRLYTEGGARADHTTLAPAGADA